MPPATFCLSTSSLDSAPIGLAAWAAGVESRLRRYRHIMLRKVLLFAYSNRLPAKLEWCAAARWVLPRRERATKEVEGVAGSEAVARMEDTGIGKLVSLHALAG